jgi:hypothetical protein
LSAVEWRTLSDGIQRREISLDLYLAIDCYDDTLAESRTETKIRERLQLLKRYMTL